MGSKSKSSKAQRHNISSSSSKSSPKQSNPPSAPSQETLPYQGPPPPPTTVSVWDKMKFRNLLGKDEIEKLKKKIENKKKAGTIESKIIVTCPRRLQDKLDAMTKSGDKIAELHLLVSSAIDCITYHISGLVRNAVVEPCTMGLPNGLRIGSRSTYCDYRTYAWDNRPKDLLHKYRSIVHHEGCHWDLRDCQDEANKLLTPALVGMPSLDGDHLARATSHFAEVREKHIPQGGFSLNKLNQHDESPGWMTHWKAILGTAISAVAAAGFAGFQGFFWYSSTGFIIKGPLGLSVALGHITSLVAGGAMMSGGLATVAAGALLYYIPMPTVFKFLKKTFWMIWYAVGDVASWLWEKVKELSTTFVALF